MAEKRKRGEESTGCRLFQKLRAGLNSVARALPADARDLPVIAGINCDGTFLVPQETVIGRVAEVLCGSRRFYTYGAGIYFEKFTDGQKNLANLRDREGIRKYTPSLLANLFVCEAERKHDKIQFQLPLSTASLLLNAEPLVSKLPHVAHYASRPVFDVDFVPLGPGYHAHQQILVHGPAIEPTTFFDSADMRQRGWLPPLLSQLLEGFCFASDADRINTVAVLLTGVLANHFIDSGKPIVLVDGNQPGVGKTLLVRTLSMVIDGTETAVMPYNLNDEELQKSLCATLRGSLSSTILIDNAKRTNEVAITSPVIEAYSMAPRVTIRILKTSTNFDEPNKWLWFVTMNQTKVSTDLMSRGLPIRLAYEGRPEDRQFPLADPIIFARDNRLGLLGELMGLVQVWNLVGRHLEDCSHRLHEWASVIGSILAANGIHGLLENYREAAETFDAACDDLAALAAGVMDNGNGPWWSAGQAGGAETKAANAAAWVPYAIKAGLVPEATFSAQKNDRGLAIRVGRALSSKVGREISFLRQGKSYRGSLRSFGARGNQKNYVLVVAPEDGMVIAEDHPSSRSQIKPDRPSQPREKTTAADENQAGPTRPRTHSRPNPPPVTPAVPNQGGNQEDW